MVGEKGKGQRNKRAKNRRTLGVPAAYKLDCSEDQIYYVKQETCAKLSFYFRVTQPGASGPPFSRGGASHRPANDGARDAATPLVKFARVIAELVGGRAVGAGGGGAGNSKAKCVRLYRAGCGGPGSRPTPLTQVRRRVAARRLRRHHLHRASSTTTQGGKTRRTRGGKVEEGGRGSAYRQSTAPFECSDISLLGERGACVRTSVARPLFYTWLLQGNWVTGVGRPAG